MNGKTQDDYIKLAAHFYKTKMAGEDITPKKITDALINNASDYRPAYFRRLKNALMFDQARQGFQKAADRIKETKNPLTRPNAPIMLKRKIKPKQRRIKSVNNDDLNKVVNKLGDTDNEVRSALLIAYYTGCRPAEMLGIKIISDTEIFIKGAKGTEQGDRGLDRKLTLEPSQVKSIDNAVNCLLSGEIRGDAKGSKTDIIHRIQSRLATLTKSVFPRRKAQMTLYSFRHQLGSNLKSSGIDRVSIAYMMGHQSTSSVDVYGDKRSTNGKIAIAPAVGLKEQKAVVRVNHEKPLSAQVKQAPVHQKTNDYDGGFSR
jgi:integrase